MSQAKSEYDEQIIALRKSGLTCAAVADELKLERWVVHLCMRRHGLQAKLMGGKP